MIETRDQKTFKWDPSKDKNLSLEIYVYFLTDVGEIALPENSNKDNNLEIFTKKHEKSTYYHHDSIYVHSIISINFDTDYRILRFQNNYDQPILVSVDLEFSGKIIEKALDDD